MIIIESLKNKRKKPSKDVQLILLGLTPGRQQHEAIDSSKNSRNVAFKGYMRQQMFEWFEALGIKKFLSLEDEDSLFTESRFLKTLYTTSLLREPVYVLKKDKKRNYSGRSPFPWKHEELNNLMTDTITTLDAIKSPCLIFPMGQIVSKAIRDFSSLDERHFIMHGFPHPSQANGHRKNEFNRNKTELRKVFLKYKKNHDRLIRSV